MLTKLYPHQQNAVDKLKHVKVGALYMEQGTGKTRTALELIQRRWTSGKIDCILWLCPCSTKANLRENIKYHAADEAFVTDIVIRGIESLSSSDRLYLQLLKLVDTHRPYLIVDESTLVKNKRAIRTERIIELGKKCEYKLILNGTPVSKNEADLFAQWYVLDWRILGYQSYYSFAANHIEYYEIRLPDGSKIIDRRRIKKVLNVDYLTEKIAPYTYQVKKAECLSLPKKSYCREAFSLTAEQRVLYENVKYRYLIDIDEMRSDTIYKLFTACQHMTSGRLVTTSPAERMETKPLFSADENPRLLKLREVINDYIQDEKCIIFAKYQAEIDEIGDLLKAMGKAYTVFTGKIPQKKRQENRQAFAKNIQFLIANKTCGAFGLNLQFCHNVIFYDNDFDLATRMQAEDRVHRIGQEHEVWIYDIYAQDSIDEFILNCLDRKENMVEAFKREINSWKETAMVHNISFITTASKLDPVDFWVTMGPIFASRSIRKEFDGYALSNEDNWTWILAKHKDELVGFISLEPKKDKVHINSMWVRADSRKKGVCRELLRRALKVTDSQKKEVTITTRKFMKPTLLKLGFIVSSAKGKNWLTFRRDAHE